MADLVLKEEGFGDLLPGADAIVIDEAHQLPEIAANFLGFVVSSRQLQALSRDLAAELLAAGARTRSAGDVRADARSSALRSAGRAARAARAHEFKEWPAYGRSNRSSACSRSLDEFVAVAGRGSRETTQGSQRCDGAARSWRSRLQICWSTADEGESVASVRWAQSSDARHVVPLSCPSMWQSSSVRLIERTRARGSALRRRSRSATDFDHFTRRVGMHEAATARFGSPFDYEQQALLYLPRGLDAPSSPRHTEQVVDAALPVLQAERWARVPAVHESSRTARSGRDSVAAARSDAAISGARAGRCAARSRCCEAFASTATRCCSGPAASGKAWT